MDTMKPLISRKAPSFSGTVRIPGDKSMSHRALMMALLTKEETIVSGLLEGDDVLNTMRAVKALGAKIQSDGAGLWRIHGAGTGHLKEPADVLDMGNSGTSTRLLAGIAAAHPVTAFFNGDASLRKRPMKRIMEPLGLMGARFETREGGRLPMAVRGAEKPQNIEYRLPVASAQVKSAILLAALNTHGKTTVIEDHPTRDHTENMLRHFGVPVETQTLESGAQAVTIDGPYMLRGCSVHVPGDASSAAFATVAACLVPGADVRLLRVGVNPRRTGLYTTLREMGADIVFSGEHNDGGEPVADILVKGGATLRGVSVPPERVPGMIDEFPVLAMAAACAQGITKMTNLSELRVKESDRLKMIANGLAACGVKLEMGEDSLTVHGTGKPPKGGALIETAMDHRIAMSFLVLGMVTDDPVSVDDGRMIDTSFPDFAELMNGLGARIEP